MIKKFGRGFLEFLAGYAIFGIWVTLIGLELLK